MQNLNSSTATDSVEMRSFPDCEEEEQLVVFELVVPTYAKVPALSQPVAGAKMVQPDSITSTVPCSDLMLLQANNTALSASWCITATLTAKRGPALRSSGY